VKLSVFGIEKSDPNLEFRWQILEFHAWSGNRFRFCFSGANRIILNSMIVTEHIPLDILNETPSSRDIYPSKYTSQASLSVFRRHDLAAGNGNPFDDNRPKSAL
jgi:hypothetical protein